LAKAELTELELAKRRGLLIDRDELQGGLSRMASILRECGERLQRHFGVEAHAILEEALNEAERVLIDDDVGADRSAGSTGRDEMAGTEQPSAPTADHARVRRTRNRRS